ncbi:MAG: TIGR01777 family protein [Candidatus Omnitrophica bacterium]|nr:TIGR01777 family protein [Candidatus Omnitrophota bacterium]
MQILVSGSSGLIGSALIPFLTGQGHRVIRLARSAPRPGEPAVQWDPQAGTIDAAALDRLGPEAVVHLAGEPIAKGRWTEKKKERIQASRIEGTRFLSEALAGLARPPKTFAHASAIGYYGSREDEVLWEESRPGTGFLAEVGREWEQAAGLAAQKGIRVVALRFGIVLSPFGGALAMMLPPFRIGLGGTLGGGGQFMSWVSIDDVVGAIHHALATEKLRGPVNVVAPNPVTNREFTRTLGKVLRRPAIFPVPAFMVRLMFGELADEALLASARVEPSRLLAAGFSFQYPELEGALRYLLTRGR